MQLTGGNVGVAPTSVHSMASPATEHPASAAESKSTTGASKKKKRGFVLKVPKGTCDHGPFEMAVREHVFNVITKCFKRHGAVTISTPVFELKETLTGKYGEDSKLIYDLADQGGEICSLRYDLTVPFARYVALNKLRTIKRYHVGRVYRRDQPSRQRGRLREFYQCDFDIAGEYPTMIPDAEVLKVLTEILDQVEVGEYQIRLSHRKLLDGVFEVCGVPEEKFRPICSAVDKLDKMTWEEVKKEMVVEKGLDASIADKIYAFVSLRAAPQALLEKLETEKLCGDNKNCMHALQDLRTLFVYLECYGVLDRVVFDMSLARGLDYYTGIIYEASLRQDGVRVGSIAGGGRYDDLVGMFCGRKVPAVGVSIGIERIFAILEEKMKKQGIKTNPTQVLVCSIDGYLTERMKLCKELWDANIPAELVMKTKPNLKVQLSYCEQNQIRWAIIFGESEFKEGRLQLKDMKASRDAQVTYELKRATFVADLKKYLET